MSDEDQIAKEERHLAKFNAIRKVLLREIVFCKKPGNEAYSTQMLAQAELSLELNAHLIKTAEQKIQALLQALSTQTLSSRYK